MERDLTDQLEAIDEARGAQLARYVAGRCSAEEAAEVRAWVAAEPGRAELLAALGRTWELAGRTQPMWDVEAAWQEVRRRREAARREAARHEGGGRVRAHRPAARVLLRAAAVVVLALGCVGVWTLSFREGVEGPREVAMHEYTTGRAQRAQVRLPDGTRVVLSVESRLRVPEDYGRAVRVVHLEGEALFDVRHDERRPFRVQAGGVVAEDLGTVFGVRSYGGESASRVVVAEGLVELRVAASDPSEAGQRLGAGDLARVGPDGAVQIERGVDATEHLAFAEGRLVFREAPLGEVVEHLGRWYDIDVRLADSTLATLPLSASFQQEPVARVLNLIALSLGLRVEREGAAVLLRR